MMIMLLIVGAVIFLSMLAPTRYDRYHYNYSRRRPRQRTTIYQDDDDWDYRYREEETRRSLSVTLAFVVALFLVMFYLSESNPTNDESYQTQTTTQAYRSR
jgi:hypothetical protein